MQTHPRFIPGLSSRYADAKRLFLRFLAFRRVNPRRNPIPSYLRHKEMVSRHVADVGGGL